MNRIFKFSLLLVAACIALVACKKFTDPANYKISPTWAIPLVDASLTVGDIINAQKSEIISVYDFTSGSDSVFYLKLVYSDTFDPISLSDFPVSIPLDQHVPAGTVLEFEERNIFLRMLGRLDEGSSFNLTNPTIEFVFENSLNQGYKLAIENTYTREKNTGITYGMQILREVDPNDIPDSATINPATVNNGRSTFEVNNSNAYTIPPLDATPLTSGALTNVFEPTPKYLYYTTKLIAGQSTGSVNSAGEIKITTNLHLPLEGFGNVTYKDTIPYDFVSPEDLEAMDFLTMRINIDNGLPMQASVSGEIVKDMDGFHKHIGTLPLYDMDQTTAKTDKIVVAGAAQATTSPSSTPTSTSSRVITDINVYKENPTTGENDLTLFATGNAVVITVTMHTTGLDNEETVKIFSDQKLDVKIGMRTGLSVDGQYIKDIIDTGAGE